LGPVVPYLDIVDQQANRLRLLPAMRSHRPIQRDLWAYRDAGLDYLVAGLRRATSPDDAARALEAVAGVLAA
jgi:hypothetical protein